MVQEYYELFDVYTSHCEIELTESPFREESYLKVCEIPYEPISPHIQAFKVSRYFSDATKSFSLRSFCPKTCLSGWSRPCGAYVQKQKRMGSVIAPHCRFLIVAGGRYYFSLAASQPLGTAMVVMSLPASCAAFTSILY